MITVTTTDRSRRGRDAARVDTSVLHVISGTARRGAEVFAQDLATELSGRGRDVHLVALAPDPHATDGFIPTLGSKRLSLGTIRSLRKQVRRAKVVVAHGSSAVVACALATVGTGVPFVYRNIGDTTYWLDRPSRRRRVRWIVRRAAAVVALWDGSSKEIRTLAGGRTPIPVIPTGVPSSRFTPISAQERSEARAAHAVGPSTTVVAFVGALSFEKNVGVIIDAVASISDAGLFLVGDGPERRALETKATDAGVGDRVRFFGAVENPRRLLAAADVIVLPSETEGIPAVLIEAGFSGLPAVATAVGGVPQIVADGQTGVLIPRPDPALLAQAIAVAVAHRREWGEAARIHCHERYEIAAVADAWDDLLAGLGAWPPRGELAARDQTENGPSRKAEPKPRHGM